jgi:catechol 2,3-dioxygenase-like lactoylglutathione lyase family enzyme
MRRYAFAVLSVLSLLTPMGSAFGAPAPAGVSPTLSVLSTGMRSSNLDRSIRFYTQGLGMTVLTTRDAGHHRIQPLDGDPARAREGLEVTMSFQHVHITRDGPEVERGTVVDRRFIPQAPVHRVRIICEDLLVWIEFEHRGSPGAECDGGGAHHRSGVESRLRGRWYETSRLSRIPLV